VYFRVFTPILQPWEKAAGAHFGDLSGAWEPEVMRKRNSKFLPLLATLAMALVPDGRAQTGTLTTVTTSPAGPLFSVDGTTYYTAMSAFWPIGSLHTLSVLQGTGYSYDQTFTTQWQFSGWKWANGTTTDTTIQVIGNLGSTAFTAVFNTSYLFSTQLACSSGPCTSVPGTIQVNGGAASPTPVWQGAGSTENLSVTSNPGYIFAGWQVSGTSTVVKYEIDTVTVNAPTTVTAMFIPSKAINFVTNPANLAVYADGTLVATPETLQWALGSSHTISAVTLQTDSTGKHWLYSSWNDGGAQTHTYVAGNNLNPETISATFAPAASAFFTTSPINLNLVIDGVVLPPPYGYIWGVGTTHTISATTPQTDSQGNLWVFQSWDDGVTTPSRTFTIPVGADVNGFRMTALYTQQAKLTVNSTISGQVVTVNGSPCTTPCSQTFTAGTQVHLTAPSSVTMSGSSRQDFVGWSTGVGAPVAGDWVATLNSPSTSVTATYRLMNLLTTTATPSKGGTWRLSPASADGYYDSQTQVAIGVAPQPGYRFSGWGGDLSGLDPKRTLSMSVPHSVTAQFSPAPAGSRRGVNNGAGIGTGEGVAAGSVASIYGESLTNQTAAAPAGSLAKSLAGVTVHLGPRTVPLYFASPSQINFQIPPDLELGWKTLTVSSPDMPDTTAEVEIVRNAPGLFPAVIEGQTYVMAMHEDGTPVSAAAPAKPGELLTLYGTGFGPTDHVRPAADAVPATPPYRILDAVTLQVGTAVVTPESAFAAPGQIGVDAVQFRLDSGVPSGAAIPLYVIVNGVNSNSLALPIQ
jgi:uncharacterized protein (TIGR03437 family)